MFEGTGDERAWRSANERPFNPGMRLRNAELIDAELGLTKVENVTLMRYALVANAVSAQSLWAGWIHYSRDRNRYAAQRRYLPAACSLRTVAEAIDQLEQADFITHVRMLPSSANEFRSRFRALPKLLSLVATAGEIRVEIAQEELLIMRDGNKREVAYSDTVRTRRMRADIHAQNAVLRDLDLDVIHPDAARDPNGRLIIRGQPVNLAQRTLARIFNCDWNHGGRWYGPFWQQLPKDIRPGIMIGGEATIESDYRALHSRLLYAAAGLDPGLDDTGFDPYAIDGIDRPVVKLAVNILLNAEPARAAEGALANKLAEMGIASPKDGARQAITAIKRARPELAQFWASGIGLRLQTIDAAMAAGVQSDMRQIEVPTLSLHDSFVVPIKARELIAESMAARLKRACQTIGKELRLRVKETCG